MFLAFIVPLIGFVLQTYPRLFNNGFGVDVWTRVLESEHMRRHGHRVPKGKLGDQFIIEGHFDYPPVFPWLLSFFRRETIIKYQGVVAPFFDSLVCVLVYYLGLYVFADVKLAMIAQVIYVLTPVTVLENSYLAPRSLGYLLFSLSTLSFFMYAIEGGYGYYVLGVTSVTVLLNAHRFATQSYLFVSIFFLFFGVPYLLQGFLLGLGLSLLVTRGQYLHTLKGHLYNIYFWVRNLNDRYTPQVSDVSRGAKKSADLVSTLYALMAKLPVFALLSLNPWVLSAGWYLLTQVAMQGQAQGMMVQLLAMEVGFFFVMGMIVLMVRYLMPIGEGQRYLEMVVPATSVLATLMYRSYSQIYPVAPYVLGTLCVGSLALIILIQIKAVIKDKDRSHTLAIQGIFDHIKTLTDRPRIICIPHQNTTMTIYHTNAQVLVNADNSGLMDLIGLYPVLTMTIDQLKAKFNLTHLLLNTAYASKKTLHLEHAQVVARSDHYELIQL